MIEFFSIGNNREKNANKFATWLAKEGEKRGLKVSTAFPDKDTLDQAKDLLTAGMLESEEDTLTMGESISYAAQAQSQGAWLSVELEGPSEGELKSFIKAILSKLLADKMGGILEPNLKVVPTKDKTGYTSHLDISFS